MQASELIARECIRDLITRYNFAVDLGDTLALSKVFHPDAVMIVEGCPQWSGAHEIIARLGRGAAAGAFSDGHFQRHHITSSLIRMDGTDTASGWHNVLVMTELGLDHAGHYADRYVRREECWMIRERVATMDWARPDSRFVYWLRSAGTNEAE